VIAALALTGCADSGDAQQLQQNEFTLRGMLANDSQKIDALQEQLARLNDRVTELEHGGGDDTTGGGGNKKLADVEARLKRLEQSSATGITPGLPPPVPGAIASPVPGAVPSPGASPGAPGAVATPPAAGTGDDTGSDEGAAGSESASSATPGASIPPSAPPAAPNWRDSLGQELATAHSDPGAKLYHAGLAALQANKYQQGLAKLQDLQRRYPKSGLSEPAEYFSANALFEMGKYDQSILQFNDVNMRFPNGRFASASLLREAQAFIKINDPIDARLTLQKLINDHPDAPEAPSARAMMQSLASG
jgi:TolA-binding protein